jgi:hypothetical protein
MSKKAKSSSNNDGDLFHSHVMEGLQKQNPKPKLRLLFSEHHVFRQNRDELTEFDMGFMVGDDTMTLGDLMPPASAGRFIFSAQSAFDQKIPKGTVIFVETSKKSATNLLEVNKKGTLFALLSLCL